MKFEVWRLKFFGQSLKGEVWSSSLKLKFEVEIWSWKLNLKLEVECWSLKLVWCSGWGFWHFDFLLLRGNFFSLFGLYQAIFGAGFGFEKIFGVYSYDNFHFVRFWFSDFFIFGFFWGHFEPFWVLSGYFGVGVGSEKFVGVYSNGLITFIL